MKPRRHSERVSPGLVTELKRYTKWSREKIELTNFEPSQPLYHYTDLNALNLILSSEKFRLSGLTHLRQSDRTEIEYGIEVGKKALRSHKPQSLWEERLLIALDANFTFEWFTRKFDCYVGCFTADPIDTEIWRDYGRAHTGVAIQFRPSYFKTRAPVPGVADFNLQKVVYGEVDIQERVRKLMLDTRIYLNDAARQVRTRRDAVALPAHVGAQMIGAFLLPGAVNTKEERYRFEAEYRGTYIRKTVGAVRPPFVFVEAQRADIGNLYYGRAVDLAALKEIWGQHGMSGRLVAAELL